MTSQPDATGHFGPYGGRFVPKVLMAPLEELDRAYRETSADPKFQAELADLLHNYAGRPTPVELPFSGPGLPTSQKALHP